MASAMMICRIATDRWSPRDDIVVPRLGCQLSVVSLTTCHITPSWHIVVVEWVAFVEKRIWSVRQASMPCLVGYLLCEYFWLFGPIIRYLAAILQYKVPTYLPGRFNALVTARFEHVARHLHRPNTWVAWLSQKPQPAALRRSYALLHVYLQQQWQQPRCDNFLGGEMMYKWKWTDREVRNRYLSPKP